MRLACSNTPQIALLGGRDRSRAEPATPLLLNAALCSRLPSPPAPWQVAVSIGFVAICSELSRLAAAWGNNVLLKINICFYLPSVPLLLLGATFDEHFDQRYGKRRTNTFRVAAGAGCVPGSCMKATLACLPCLPALRSTCCRRLHIPCPACAGFGGCAAVLLAFPFVQGHLLCLLGAVVALGVFSAAAAGSSYQLATQQDDGGSATVAVALGYVSSAPVVLLVEAGWRIGPLCPWHKVLVLYATVAAITAAALAAAMAIVRRQQPAQEPLVEPLLHEWAQPEVHAWLAEGIAASSTAAAAAGARSNHVAVDDDDDSVLLDGGDAAGVQRTLLTTLWPAAASLSISIATSMLLFPLFPHFRSSGAVGHTMLPVVLFWVRALADIAGRLLPKLASGPPPAAAVLSVAALRLLLLPLPLLRIAGHLPAPLQSDWLLVAFVAAQWLAGGAVNVWAFLLLPRLVPAHLGPRAASVMTLTFNTSCLAGLLLAIPVQSLIS